MGCDLHSIMQSKHGENHVQDDVHHLNCVRHALTHTPHMLHTTWIAALPVQVRDGGRRSLSAERLPVGGGLQGRGRWA